MILVLIFVLAASADAVTMLWHRAREREQTTNVVILSMMLEALTWLPVIAFVVADDIAIAAVSVIGSGAGTFIGMRRAARASQRSRSKGHLPAQQPSGTHPIDAARTSSPPGE